MKKYLEYFVMLHPLKILKTFILNLRNRNGDYNNCLIITGTLRSGTTWLAELLNNIPNSILIYEPLHIRRNIYSKKAGFKWRTYINPEENSPDYYNFFRKMFNFKVLCSYNLKYVPLLKTFNSKYYIFKFVRANMLIVWLINNFPVKKPVLIIRHPCAVVSSRLNTGWGKPNINKELYENFPVFKNIIKDLNLMEEKLAALWCEDYYIPLTQNKQNSFILVCYEKLISDPEGEVRRIFREWKMDMPDEILKKLNIPSKSFVHNQNNEYLIENNINSKKLLSRWKSELNTEQVSRILNIVKIIGMDFYTEELEPDYERLYGDSPINV